MAVSDRLKQLDMYPKEEPENPVISPELLGLCAELNKSLSKKIAAIPIWFDYSKD